MDIRWRAGTPLILPLLLVFILFFMAPGAQGDDPFEENDELATAAPIEPGVYANLNSSDPDCFLINCSLDGTLKVTVWYPAGIGEVTLSLFHPNGTLIETSDTGSGEEQIVHTVSMGEQYVFEVGNRSITDYHLAVVTGNEDSWIFSVYMDGDNTLHDNMEPDLVEMRVAGSGNGLHIPVLKDGEGSKDTSVLYVVKGGEIVLPAYVVNQSWGKEVNMGDRKILGDWLSWCYRTFDTDSRIALDLWDHGKGVWGCCWDANSGNDLLTLEDIRWGIEAAGFGEASGSMRGDGGNASPVLELLGSDSCLMQVIELPAETSHLAHYFIASQEDEPKDGWDYEPFLRDLRGNLTWTGLELGTSMVDSYMLEYGTNGDETLSLISMEEIPALIEAVIDLRQELGGNMGMWADEIRSARDDTRDFNYYYADIMDFSLNLLQRTDNDTLRALIDGIIHRLDMTIVYEDHGAKSYDSHGMSIYFPKSGYDHDYDDIEFSEMTGWGDFLQDWIATPGGPTDHFERAFFYERDNSSDEKNDTILVKMMPYTDRDQDDVNITVELVNASGEAVHREELHLTLQHHDAGYTDVYLTLADGMESGEYWARISLYDSEGNRDDIRTSDPFMLFPLNDTSLPSPPYVRIISNHGEPARPNEGEYVEFQAVVITGNVVYFTWDFEGDGSARTWGAKAVQASYRYPLPGTYTLVLTVRDEWGQTVNVTLEILVNDYPTIIIPDPITSNPGLVDLNITTSDTDGEIALYEWDFDGDGSHEGLSTLGFPKNWIFSQAGNNPIGFRVTDTSGAVTERNIIVHINLGPDILSEPLIEFMEEGVRISISAVDLEGGAMTYHWDVDGDGSVEQVTGVNWTLLDIGPEVDTVMVTVTDDMGLIASRSLNITWITEPEIEIFTQEGIQIQGSNLTYLSKGPIILTIVLDGTHMNVHRDLDLKVSYGDTEILSDSLVLNKSDIWRTNITLPTPEGESILNITITGNDFHDGRELVLNSDVKKEKDDQGLLESSRVSLMLVAISLIIFFTVISIIFNNLKKYRDV